MVDKATGGIKLVDTASRWTLAGFGRVGPEIDQRGLGMTPKLDVFAVGEIAHKGMERGQFGYGGKSTFGDDKFMEDFREFGKMDADGKPLHQALSPSLSNGLSSSPAIRVRQRLHPMRTSRRKAYDPACVGLCCR